MAQLNPYVNFEGNTEEAFNFYKSVIGGEFTSLVRFKDTPAKDAVPPAEQDKLMHVCLRIGDTMLMGTDALASMGHRVSSGTNFSLSIHGDTVEESQRIFDGLAEGGTITVPFKKEFWGDMFGQLTDKFGMQWMVTHADKKD